MNAETVATWADRALETLRRPLVARVLSASVALTIAAVFTLSALLVPSADGHGTHLQLGLGQCSFLLLTGQPCPMCGATTSFALMAHLRPIDAWINQPFAALLFVLSAGVLGVAVAEVVDPRGRWSRLANVLEPRETLYAGLFLAVMAASWAYKVARMNGLF